MTVDVRSFVTGPLAEAYLLLPAKMDTPSASIQVIATCLQESGLVHRVQLGNGPAHGFAQMELGKPGTGAGVTGICEFPGTRDLVRSLCQARNVPFSPIAIWNAITNDDVLALGMARLGYWTNAAPLPAVGDQAAAFRYYVGTWHPGAYDRGTQDQRDALAAKWRGNYATAQGAVLL